MPPTPTTTDMGHRHEADVAEALGMGMTRGSGSGADKGDAAHHHDLPFAFRADCKSTKGKQIAVTLAMLEKLREQAGGERPALPLRWYANEALTKVAEDWVAITLADISELIADARETAALREQVKSLRTANASLEAYNVQAGEIISRQRRELQTPLAANPGQQALATPGFVPKLPWTIIHTVHTDSGAKNAGLYYDVMGMQTTVDVRSVRVERSLGGSNRPRLIVNDTKVTEGALYVDGKVRVVVSASDRSIEMG